MFSVADKGQQVLIDRELVAAGFTTYLPQEDGIEIAQAMRLVESGLNPLSPSNIRDMIAFARKIGFALDIYQAVERCKSLVLNMDGRVPDEGSVVEAAAAFAAGKPIVVFKSTPISILGGYASPMIEGLATNWTFVEDVTAIPAGVSAAVAARSAKGKKCKKCKKCKKGKECKECKDGRSRHLRACVKLGCQVWENIDRIHQAMFSTPEDLLALVRDLEGLWATELNAVFGPYKMDC